MKKIWKRGLGSLLCLLLISQSLTDAVAAEKTYIVDIFAHSSDSVAVMSDGSVWGWGLGRDYTTNGYTAGQTVRNTPRQELTGGYTYAGEYRWYSGEYDLVTTAKGATMHREDGKWVTVNANVDKDICGYWTWKKDGTLWDQKTGRQVDSQVVEIAGSDIDTCAYLKADGSLWLLGSNYMGIAEGEYFTSPYPVMSNVEKFIIDRVNLFILTRDNKLYGFGDNQFGQLGQGYASDVPIGGPYLILKDVAAVDGDGYSLFAIREDDSLWAWGLGYHGALGTGELGLHYDDTMYYYWRGHVVKPTKVMDDVAKVSHGVNHTLILKKDGTLWATGCNQGLQIGDGALPTLNQWGSCDCDRLTPVQIKFGTALGNYQEPPKPLTDFADVNAGDYYEKPIQWAVAQGITSGTSETTFSPTSYCTQGQILAFLWRAFGN